MRRPARAAAGAETRQRGGGRAGERQRERRVPVDPGHARLGPARVD